MRRGRRNDDHLRIVAKSRQQHPIHRLAASPKFISSYQRNQAGHHVHPTIKSGGNGISSQVRWCPMNSPPEPTAAWLSGRPADLGKGEILDRVLHPVLIVKVPPFELVNSESFRLYRFAQKVAKAASLLTPIFIVSIGSLREFVVGTGHGDFLARPKLEERQIHGVPAIMPGALFWVSDEASLFRWSLVPEKLGHRPGPVGVEDEKAVTLAASIFGAPAPGPLLRAAAGTPGLRDTPGVPGSCASSRSGYRA